jgi:WD40 repeat protein
LNTPIGDPQEGTLRIVDTANGKTQKIISHGAPCYVFAYHPDGTIIASVGKDERIKIWNRVSGEQVRSSIPIQGDTVAIAFSDDGRYLAHGDGKTEYAINVWNTQTWNRECSWPITFQPRAVSFNPDSSVVVAGGTVQNLFAWKLGTKELCFSKALSQGFAVKEVFATENRIFATTGLGVEQFDYQRTILSPLSILANGGRWIHQMTLSPGRRLIACGGRDSKAHVFDASTGQRIFPALNHGHAVDLVAFSDDERWLLTASADGIVQIWDSRTGARAIPPIQHPDKLLSASFNHDGSKVLTSTSDNTYLCDLITAPHAGPVLKLSTVRRAAFADPKGSYLLTVDDSNTTHRWNVETGSEVGGVENIDSQNIAPLRFLFAPPIAHPTLPIELALLASNELVVRDTRSGDSLSQIMRHREAITFAAFSEDGNWVITGSADTTAHVWDTRSGRAITPSLPAGGEVYSAIFSNDKQRLAVFSKNKSVSIWRLDSNLESREVLAARDRSHQPANRDHRSRFTWLWNSALKIVEESSRDAAFKRLDTVEPVSERLALQSRIVFDFGDTRSALPLLNEAVSLRPDDEFLRFTLGMAYERLGDWNNANQHYLKAARQAKTVGTYWMAAAESSLRLGQLDQADTSAKKALIADSRSAAALETRARISEARLQWTKAFEDYQEAARYRRLAMMPETSLSLWQPNTDRISEIVSLAGFCNDYLEQYPFKPHIALQPLVNLKRGVQWMNGKLFLVDGAIRLNGTGDSENGAPYPTAVHGIPIRRKCSKIHLLHTFQHFEQLGVEVASVEFVYIDGYRERLPLLYGHHGYECNYAHGKRSIDKNTLIAWEKKVPIEERQGMITQTVYQTVWENPRPKVEIVMLHYSSAMKITCPILYAVTCDS